MSDEQLTRDAFITLFLFLMMFDTNLDKRLREIKDKEQADEQKTGRA